MRLSVSVCCLWQDPVISRSLVVLLVCVICLLCYAVAAAVLRKLDQLDLRQASVVPLCGKDGLYKYEIQVKTGWSRGAGEEAEMIFIIHFFLPSVSIEVIHLVCVFTHMTFESNKSSISGTTAHVGISLHGNESRSGHRHLDQVGAFTRNSLDIFHIATDSNLGNLCKIRVWHDNKGML